jgi:UDPglucose 6-dehydrogenase
MRIGIAGYGFVGQAHHKLLKDTHDVVISDPAYSEYSSRLPKDIDAIIVCVSTPARETGSCNMNNVYEVVESAPNVPILIKSTISVEGWDMLVDAFPDKQLAFSPEFLRAASALEDLQKTKLMFLGGAGCRTWREVFHVDIEIAEPRELILAKYARNSFLALKVAFFNQMYDLCDALDVEYSAVAHYTTMDERIGDSHSFITEERGFGGHCLPKDTNAIVHTGKRNDVELSLIKQAIKYNSSIRKGTT